MNRQTRAIKELLQSLEPSILNGFMASVDELYKGVNWGALMDALRRGDIDSALNALNISTSAFSSMELALSNAYIEAGLATMATLKSAKTAGVGTRFDGSNPRARQWIQNNSSELITGFTRELIEAARSTISAGYTAGNGVNTIALDLVGRAGQGWRSGGIMGLDKMRAQRFEKVVNAMRSAEGVKSIVNEALDGTLTLQYKVNKATESRIFKAYRQATAVSAKDIEISSRQFSNALLKSRGETVANTEVANSVMAARQEAWQQLLEQQNILPEQVIKTWQHRRGEMDGRQTHIEISGKKVRGLLTKFVLSNGDEMLHPHDPEGGARNKINCACACEYTIDWSGSGRVQ